ncbi:hypothetical protein NliqN6_3264 [Naganishia liquefaciens]|uniref:TOG domain-containing protein n=1 Tax=Naganishia liquefaciens TaxID=104408 RepID=A0A8H3YG45_9TREE|nr:hypothetical protein NliqN6_3264 [Naganishia liquefaciens]
MNIPALTEDVVLEQVAKIRQADVTRKVDVVQFFSLQLEATQELTVVAIDAINGLIPTLIASHSHLLYQSTLTSLLPTYLPHLAPLGLEKVRSTAVAILPSLFDKLSDGKDRVSKPAEEALVRFAQTCLADTPLSSSATLTSSGRGKEKESPAQIYERLLTDVLAGKNPRGKVGVMRVLVGVRAQSRTIGLKALLPSLVAALEDGDGSVREEAKSTLIALLSPSDIPPSVHAELRKMMQARNIKPALVETVMGSLIAPEAGTAEEKMGSQAADVPRVMVATERELEHDFVSLVQPFAGKETEHNWQGREAAVIRVRGMILGGAYKKFGSAFVNILRHEFWPESTKGVVSLRTTLATATCSMYIDIARALGDAFDVLTDTLVPHLLKLSGSTKKIVAEASQQVITAIIAHAACPPRTFMPFLEAGLAERTVQSRGYFMAHLVQYVRAQCARPQGRQAIEGTQILNSSLGTAHAMLTEMIRRGLTDASPAVKESARTAFVVFHREWPKQGAALLASLEDGVRRQVEKVMASATLAEPVIEVDSRPIVAAPQAARRATAGRKPSSAIAAAIRKAKEEARAAKIAEAAREEQENGMTPGPVDDPPLRISNAAQLPIPPTANAVPLELPETPNKDVSLLDLQTPENRGASLKVMTPAPLPGAISLLKTTGISLVEPSSLEAIVASQDEPKEETRNDVPINSISAGPVLATVESGANIPQDLDIGPASSKTAISFVSSESDVQAQNISHLSVSPAKTILRSQDCAKSASNSAIQHSPSSSIAIPRRPRVSVDPASQTIKPQPLYAKLRKIVDCSFWLDRRQEFPDDGEETLDALLERRHSPVTVKYVLQLVGWSNHRAAKQQLDELNDDDEIREYICGTLQTHTTTDGEAEEILPLIGFLESTIVSHQDDAVLKACLFLLWNLFVSAPHLWTEQARPIIRCCLALRRSDSISLRYGTAGLLALFVTTTSDKIHVLQTLLSTTQEVLASSPDAVQSRLVVFALVNVAALVCTLPSGIIKDQIPGIKQLLLQAIDSRAIPSREAAYTTLVAIQSSLGIDDDGYVLVRDIIPELTEAQRRLAMYMIQRDLGDEKSEDRGEGLVEEMARLSRRL